MNMSSDCLLFKLKELNGLNLENAPGGYVSGVSTAVLEWICEESNERFLHELASSFDAGLNEQENVDRTSGAVNYTLSKEVESS